VQVWDKGLARKKKCQTLQRVANEASKNALTIATKVPSHYKICQERMSWKAMMVEGSKLNQKGDRADEINVTSRNGKDPSITAIRTI